MSASSASSFRASKGFSLVELLVALVFTSILMAGMLKVFQSSISTFATTSETIGIQRNARWALSLLRDEVSQAGYLIPPRIVGELSQFGQEPLQIDTTTTAVTYTDNTGTVSIGKPDELILVMDQPLGVEGSVSTAVAVNDASLSVTIPSGGASLQDGDVLFIQDSNWEMFKVTPAGSSGSTYTFTIKATTLDQYGNDQGGGFSPIAGVTHLVGAPVTFVRPLQVVRYTIQALNLDPASATATVPCLVRQVKTIGAATWASTQVVVEGVTGFRADWSVDGGTTFIRRDNGQPADWTTIKADTQAAMDARRASSLLVAQAPPQMSAPQDPMWFNYIPVLLRLDVETRTRLKRSEYTPDNLTADYRTRQQTLMVSPRNFALGQPQ